MSFTKEECIKWEKDPGKNPRNNRKLKTDAKKGIYNQLVAICAILLKEEEKEDKEEDEKKHEHKSPNTNDNLEADRLRLIRAIRKAIKPILHRIDSNEMRVTYNNIISNYIKNIKPCLQEAVTKKSNNNTTKLVLNDNKSNPIVTFDKQIGSKSVYGLAYMNTGKKFAKLLKFSCKLMEIIPNNTKEVHILNKMTQLVINGVSPNMPITYKVLKCTSNCNVSLCPQLIMNRKYYVVISELANYDIQNWLKETHTNMEYNSVIMQLVFALQAFHNMKYTHNDTHLGNFLIHKIKPGGYWHYKLKDIDIYIPNCGYLLVLWDPGLAELHSNVNYKNKITYNSYCINDFTRPLQLLYFIEINQSYLEMGLKPLSSTSLETIKFLFVALKKLNKYTFYDIFNNINIYHKTKIPGILFNETPKQVINNKPYIL